MHWLDRLITDNLSEKDEQSYWDSKDEEDNRYKYSPYYIRILKETFDKED